MRGYGGEFNRPASVRKLTKLVVIVDVMAQAPTFFCARVIGPLPVLLGCLSKTLE